MSYILLFSSELLTIPVMISIPCFLAKSKGMRIPLSDSKIDIIKTERRNTEGEALRENIEN